MTFVSFHIVSIFGAGNFDFSISIIALSTHHHNFSQNHNLCILSDNKSFLAFQESIKRVTSMIGIHGFVISIRFQKISIRIFCPVQDKS